MTIARTDAAHRLLTTHVPVPWLGTHKVSRDLANPLQLGDVRDMLAQQVSAQEYEDQEYTLGHYHVRTGDSATTRTTVQRMNRTGLVGDEMPLTRTGLQQLARNVLPARGLSFVEQLAQLETPQGRKMADVNWAMFMRAAKKPRMVRTALYEDRGVTRRTIRSVVSQSYARVDDLQLVELLLNSPEAAQLPVLAYDRTDTMLRMRLALEPIDAVQLNKPVAIVDVTNSEVGGRSVTMRAGIWKLICTNGMASVEKGGTWRWAHSGNPQRIMNAVPQALEDMRTACSPMIQAYDHALGVAIDDAISWMEHTLGDHLTVGQLASSAAAMLDETTTPGGRLASVVDAVTLAAQGQDSLEAREAMEIAGGMALRIGLGQAQDGRLLAPAK